MKRPTHYKNNRSSQQIDQMTRINPNSFDIMQIFSKSTCYDMDSFVGRMRIADLFDLQLERNAS